MTLSELNNRIDRRQAKLGVIGLGYVGLPIAALFAEAGFDVIGIEIRAERVIQINQGISPIEGDEPGLAELLGRAVRNGKLRAATDYSLLQECDIILVDVETPVDDARVPRYQALRSALSSLAPVLKKGALVIVESTIAPGTMQGVCLPLLQEGSGKMLDQDFYLGNCPERVMPGKLLANLRSLSRVCGGSTPETAEMIAALYRQIVQADLDTSDWITAELVKTVENTYRDVQIAFANEVAVICEALGGDVWKVRELVNKSPYRNMHLPGAGVGGHCIPKDPWLLAYGVRDTNLSLRIIPAARQVNDSMPLHMADLTAEALAEAGCALKGARILVLGYAYLENSDDTRNSPSQALVARLEAQGVQVVIQDPYVSEYQQDPYAAAGGCDAVVVMVRHQAYLEMDWDRLLSRLNHPVMVDGRRVIRVENIKTPGMVFRGVGQG